MYMCICICICICMCVYIYIYIYIFVGGILVVDGVSQPSKHMLFQTGNPKP